MQKWNKVPTQLWMISSDVTLNVRSESYTNVVRRVRKRLLMDDVLVLSEALELSNLDFRQNCSSYTCFLLLWSPAEISMTIFRGFIIMIRFKGAILIVIFILFVFIISLCGAAINPLMWIIVWGAR